MISSSALTLSSPSATYARTQQVPNHHTQTTEPPTGDDSNGNSHRATSHEYASRENFRSVWPSINATQPSTRQALQQYQSIQQSSEPELLNRVDVMV